MSAQNGILRHLMGVDVADSELYRKHADDLTRFATGLVGPDHAADVVSEAVIGCLEVSRLGKPGGEALLLILIRLQRGGQISPVVGPPPRTRAFERHRPSSSKCPRFDPKFEPPSPVFSTRQRAVIVLTYWDDLDPGAIAKLLDISAGSVKRHLARGRSHLKEALDAD